MVDDRPPYTHVASWVKLFRKDPMTLLSFLKEWEDIASWLIYKQMTHRDDDYIRQRIDDFSGMSEVLIAWGDQTIHADMSPLQDLFDRVSRFAMEVDYDGSPIEQPTEADVIDTFGRSLCLTRRLELAASIALGVPLPLPMLNEVEIGASSWRPFSSAADTSRASKPSSDSAGP